MTLRFPSSLLHSALRSLVALLALSGLAAGAHAQNAFSFPTAVSVGQSSAPQAITVSLSTPGATVAGIEVLAMGAPNMDFTENGRDTCTGLTSGACLVGVVFSPKFPGIRNGAVVLLDASGNIVGTSYLSGTGVGPLGVLLPGAISTIAGQTGKWTQINDGAPATQADLYLPSGLAVDGLGDVFIADSNHNRIREVLAVDQGSLKAGTITTVAGDGNAGYDPTATDATHTALNLPGAVAVDGAGNLYIADSNNNVIRRVNLATNTIVTVAGTGQPGYTNDGNPATSARLNAPQGITVDGAGNLYIADTGNNAIRKVDTSGTITTVVGDGTGQPGYTGDGALATAATLNAPYGVAFDPAGNMYIPDSANNVIRRVDPSQHITTWAGNGAEGYTGDGDAPTSAELYSPRGVACDAAGNVYIADARNYVIRKVNVALNTIGTVAGENSDNFFVDGKTSQNYGNSHSGENFSGGGVATISGIYAPYAIAVDPAGNMIIAEYFDNLVREVVANNSVIFVSPALWLNQSSAPQTQLLENDGNAPLSITAIQPDANAAYDASKSTCTTTRTVAIDARCYVYPEFVPSIAGDPLVANVNLVTNQPNTPLNIQLIGQGLSQNQVNVTLTSKPNPATFGTAVTFSASVAKDPSSKQGVPTGTVTFSETANGVTTPLGAPATLDSNGTAALPVSTLSVGTHMISAEYSGDTYYSKSASNPVTQVIQEQVTVGLTSSSPNNSSTLGAPVTFTAAVTVSGGIPVTGSVSFYDGATFLGTGSLSGAGVASFVTSGLPVGKNSIAATYTDVNGVSASSSPLIQSVQQQTATTVVSSLNPSVHGSAVTFTATVLATGSTAPTGTVTFSDGATRLGTGTLVVNGTASGVATFETSALPAGTHTITASYSGDVNDFSSTSTALTQTVQSATTTASLTAGANPAIAGKALTLTATVSANAGVPAGTVSFFSGAALLGTGTLDAKGIAILTTSKLTVGSYALTVSYKGDANNDASTSPALALTVIQATTSVALTASAPTAIVTNPVTFTAKVTGNGGIPGGSVTFLDGSNTLGSAPLNASGVAAYTTSALGLGAHSITARYLGDDNDAPGASAAVTETITAYVTQTSLAASASTLDTDQKLTLLATITSTGGHPPTGTVTFMNGTSSLGTAQIGSGGSATFSLTPAAGTYSITAHYGGDTYNAPSTSGAVSVTVAQATEFTIALDPSSLTIPTSKHATVDIALASKNSFTDTMALGCSSLPAMVTCNFSKNDVELSANGQASVQLVVDTASPLLSGGQAKNEAVPAGPTSGLLAACVFPGAALFGFAFWRFRKNAGLLRMLAILAVLAGTTLAMTGCGGLSLNSASAGSYVIQVTATGQKTGIVHVANLTVQVTK